MMKKVFIALVLSVACIAGSFAGETYAKKGMLIAPGDMAATVGFDFGLGANLGFEYAIGNFNLGDFKFTYGAKGVGGAYMWPSGIAYTVGAVGTVHFSWACIKLPKDFWWVQNIDSFIGLGVGYYGFSVGDYSWGNVGLFSHGGSSYFFSKKMAVTVAGGLGGSYLGVLFKL